MRWMYFDKNIGRQVNVTLIVAIIFVIFGFAFSQLEYMTSFAVLFKWLCVFFVVYLFVFALMLTKKWIDKMYK